MIQNLVVNGCSFTQGNGIENWPNYLQDLLKFKHLKNLAQAAAGNNYICKNTVDYLESHPWVPAETLILIMWSGADRIDVSITDEWYNYIKSGYMFCSNNGTVNRIHCARGTHVPFVTNLFGNLHKTKDEQTMCIDSLQNFILLENYLKSKGYRYLFTNYFNCWEEAFPRSPISKDCNIGYYCKDLLIYKNFDFSNWFFVNNNRDCIGDLFSNCNLDDIHPNATQYKQFAEQIVLPRVQQIHM